MKKQAVSLILLFILAVTSYAQQGRIYNLRNCQGEMRMATFQGQVNMIWKCISGMATIREQRVLHFAEDYKLDTAFFESQVQKVRKALPPNFFRTLDYLGDWHDNIPDEPAIWFTQIFAQKDKQGNYKVYAAIKISFDRTDARIDAQRRDPQIKDLTFIFDKAALDKLGQRLKTSPESMPKSM